MTQLALFPEPRRRHPHAPGYVLLRAARPDWPHELWSCAECGAFEQPDGSFPHVGEPCRREAIRRAKVTHGASGTPMHQVWGAMIQRCTNPNSADYPDYGGRGIRVCERWRSFQNFVDDMGSRPSAATIERVDTNGDYEPSNCRWATQTEQARNRRNSFLIELDGVRLTAPEWSERTGLNARTIKNRIMNGWSPARALTEPAFVGKNQHRVVA